MTEPIRISRLPSIGELVGGPHWGECWWTARDLDAWDLPRQIEAIRADLRDRLDNRLRLEARRVIFGDAAPGVVDLSRRVSRGHVGHLHLKLLP